MIKSDKNVTVGIFGHYGNENLGDESIIAAVDQNVRKRFPHARIVGLSINPADTAERHGFEAYAIRALDADSGVPSRVPAPAQSGTPSEDEEDRDQALAGRIKSFVKRIPLLGTLLRGIAALPAVVKGLVRETRFLKDSYKVAKKVDLFFVSGSNQFLDNYGGPLGFPYTLFKWTVLAKLAGNKVAFVSIGAGPLDRWISKMFVRKAIQMSEYCSLRDAGSQELIQSLGGVGQTSVYPDLAYSLSVDPGPGTLPSSGDARGVVGINPMPVFDHRYWFVGDAAKYRSYTEKLSTFAHDLIERGYVVQLFPTQIRDELVIDDIISVMKERYGAACLEQLRTARCGTLPDLLELIRGTDFVVATRFHGVILSLLMERPVLGICYQKKTFEAMERYGLSDYAEHLERFQPDGLTERLLALAAERDRVTEIISTANVQHERSLGEQYDRVLGLLLDQEPGATHG